MRPTPLVILWIVLLNSSCRSHFMMGRPDGTVPDLPIDMGTEPEDSGSPDGPFIGMIVPHSGPTAGGTLLTLSGARFAEGARVTVGGVDALDIRRESETTLKVTTPARPARPGRVDVNVVNPDGKEATARHAFTYYLDPLTFAEPVTTVLSLTGTFVIAADMNGDGKADVATCNSRVAPNQLSVLIGDGRGGFSTENKYLTSTAPYSINAADADGDGVLDLLTGDYGGDSVRLFKGKGDGTFTAMSFKTGISPVTSGAIGDVDKDGLLDLVAVSQDINEVALLKGRSVLSFDAPRRLRSTEGSSDYVQLVDVNSDGRDDIVVAASGDTVYVLVAQTDGSFSRLRIPGVQGPHLRVADLDADTRPDIVAVTAMKLVVIPGRGDGLFDQPRAQDAGGGLSSVALSDLNGDGFLDVLVAGRTSGVGLLLGRGDGSFMPPKKLGAELASASSVAAADFDGDGLSDVVAAGTAKTLHVMLNRSK